MSDTRAAGIGVTIKYGKEYDKTWATFTGTANGVRNDLCAYFGLDRDEQVGLSLNEIVINVTQIAHGVTRAVSGLGGTVIPKSQSPDTNDEAQSSPFPEQEQDTTTQDPYAALNAQVEATVNVTDLRRLYADNTAMFTADTDEAKAAKKAWQAKGKALQKSA